MQCCFGGYGCDARCELGVEGDTMDFGQSGMVNHIMKECLSSTVSKDLRITCTVALVRKEGLFIELWTMSVTKEKKASDSAAEEAKDIPCRLVIRGLQRDIETGGSWRRSSAIATWLRKRT